jgi:hypothetical protein
MTDAQPRIALIRRIASSLLAAALLHSPVARADRDVITLDAKTQQRSGIRLVTLHNGAHPQRLRAYGTVLDAQPLAELRGRYADAQGRLRTAQAKLAASKAAFERARMLYAERQNISAAELQAAQASYRVDEASFAAARSRLQTLNAEAQQAWGRVLGRALAEDGPLAARLIDRKDLLLQVTLPPGRVPESPAREAFVRLDGDARVPIALVSIAPRTDPHIQGTSYFYTASAGTSLLPGMSVVAYLPSGKTIEGAIVPAAAVVWSQGGAFVYLRTGKRAFARRAIATDVPAPGGGYIVRGLPEGAKVVVQGAQMLLSEEYRAPVGGGARGDGDDD